MSSISGLAASKTDKNKAKFKTIDINNVYKGTSVGPPKATGNYYFSMLYSSFICDVYAEELNIYHEFIGPKFGNVSKISRNLCRLPQVDIFPHRLIVITN